MTFLPIVGRELRVASRRRSTYWMRAAAALWALGLGTWLFLVVQNETPPDIAKALLGLLTGSALLYALLSGVRSTADCLSEEKREGTLGLLFLTDLKGYDVVLGKLFASSLGTFYGVMAVVPMLAIPLLLGGVTLGEFGRMALVILNTMFFSLSVGMAASSVSRSARKAAATTLFIVLFISAVLPAIGVGFAQRVNANRVHPGFLLASPGYGYYLAWDFTFRVQGKLFWYSLGAIHALGWLFLALASWVAPRSWQDKTRGKTVARWSELWTAWSYGKPEERKHFRKRLLDRNPFLWLVARARFKPALVWAVLFLLGGAWALGLAKYGREWLSVGLYMVTGIILNLLLKAWFTAETCRQVIEDRQSGALELLLSTPLSVPELLRGQILALRRQFLGPGLVVLMVFFVLLFAGLREIYSERSLWVLTWVSAMVLLVGDVLALFWVAMWDGLSARRPQRAATSSLARVIALPWLVVAIAFLVMTLTMMVRGDSDLPGYFFFWVLLGASVATDFAFAAHARHKLLTAFREVAARRYLPRERFWFRLFGLKSQPSGRPLPAARTAS